MYIYKYN